MEYLENIKSENKAVRRNGLKQIIATLEKQDDLCNSIGVQLVENLPFTDSYDTCRELSFKISSILLSTINDELFDTIANSIYETIKELIRSKKLTEVEAVRVNMIASFSTILSRENTSFIKKHIDEIIELLRIVTTDSCPEVLQSLLAGMSTMVLHFINDVHMVSEQIVFLLKPLLRSRQHNIRFNSITLIKQLMMLENDRNECIMDEMNDSLFMLLKDSYKDIRREVLLLLQHCLTSPFYKNCRLCILETLSEFNDEDNKDIVEAILSTPLN